MDLMVLSHVITRDNIILNIKNSKDCIKTIRIGAYEEYNVKKLAWILNPDLMLKGPYLFELKVEGESAKFTQTANGEYEFSITSDEKLNNIDHGTCTIEVQMLDGSIQTVKFKKL